MDDRVERREGGIVADDLGAQRRAVERAVLAQHVGSESARDRRKDGTSWRLRFAGEAIRVDHRSPPAFEQLHDCGFARSDVASEAYVEHGPSAISLLTADGRWLKEVQFDLHLVWEPDDNADTSLHTTPAPRP